METGMKFIKYLLFIFNLLFAVSKKKCFPSFYQFPQKRPSSFATWRVWMLTWFFPIVAMPNFLFRVIRHFIWCSNAWRKNGARLFFCSQAGLKSIKLGAYVYFFPRITGVITSFSGKRKTNGSTNFHLLPRATVSTHRTLFEKLVSTTFLSWGYSFLLF